MFVSAPFDPVDRVRYGETRIFSRRLKYQRVSSLCIYSALNNFLENSFPTKVSFVLFSKFLVRTKRFASSNVIRSGFFGTIHVSSQILFINFFAHISYGKGSILLTKFAKHQIYIQAKRLHPYNSADPKLVSCGMYL